MIAISAYSLLLLKTVPSPAGRRSYFATQLMAIAIGYLGAWLITLIDYRDMSNLWYLIAGFCIFLLIYTHFFGIAVQNSGGINARAWISIPGLGTFQPSELVKIGFILTFSKHLSVLKERGLLERPLQVVLLGVHALIPVAVMFQLQGDAGSAAIFFCMFLAMSFGAGVQLRYFVGLFAAIGAAFPLVWKYLWTIIKRTVSRSFYIQRNDPTGKGLQQLQGKISIGKRPAVGAWTFFSGLSRPKGQRAGSTKRLHLFCRRRTARFYRLHADYFASFPSIGAHYLYCTSCNRTARKLHLFWLFRDDCFPNGF